MEIKKVSVGIYQANCYLVKKNKEVLVIDPGANFNKIMSFIEQDEHICGICLTHGHFDHISAVDEIQRNSQCDVYVSAEEYELLIDPEKNYSLQKKVIVQSKVRYYEPSLILGPFEIIVHETPGHSPGSVCLEIEGHLFSGDTLFKGSVGRTDLYRSNQNQLKQSLKQIKQLSPDLKVHPGHESSTTLEIELKTNPYLK